MLQGLEEFDPDTDEEQCGVLIGKEDEHGVRHVNYVVKIPNRAQIPTDHFAISLCDFNEVAEEHVKDGNVICGFLHTHPGDSKPYPSADDLFGLLRFGDMIGVVYHPKTKNLTWFNSIGVIAREADDED